MPAQPLWNAADKDADLTLSNANRTWQAASGLVGAVRSTIGLSAGKWHVQLSHVSSAGSAARHGFATAGHAIGTPPGDTAQSWVINGQGTIRAGGSNGADYDNFANGDAVDLFVDLDAGRIWYGRGGTVHAGNPAAGTGAMHSFTGGTTLFLAGGMDGGGTTRGGTLRLLADYVGTTPAGFSRGWGSAGDGVELTIGAAALAVQGRGATLVSGTGQGLAVATSGLAAGGAAVGLSVGMLGQAAAGAAAATGALASVQAGVGAFATAIGGEVVLAGGSAEAAISGGIALAAAAGRCITTGAAGALVAGQMLMAAAAVPMATGHPGLLQAGTGQLCEAGAATIEATGSPVVIGAGAGVDCISVPGAVAWAGSPIALSAGQLLHGGPGGVQASPGAADLLAGAGQSLASATASVVLSGAVPSVIGGAGVALDAMAGEWFANGHSVGLAVGTGAVLAVARGEVVLAEGLASVSIAWDFAGTVAAGGATIVGGACVVAAGTPVLNPVPMPGDLAALLAPAAGTLEWVVTIDAWDAETATLVPLRWSAGDYITRAADDPASTRFPGRLADFQLRRQLWSGMAVFGRSEPARGVVVLENADGALDHLATAVTTTGGRRWHFRWRRVQVMVGHPAWPWAAFRPVFTGLVEEPAFDDGRATFLVRDRLRRLDRPLQDATFRGDRVLLASASSVAVGFGARTFVLPDLVANGGFATSLAGWDAGADWIGGSARATKSPGVSAALEQNLATAADNLYRVRLDVVRTAGSLQPMAGGEPVGDPIAATGTYRPTFLAVGSTTRLSFRADADFAGTVDAVSVRQEPLAVAGDGVRIARTGDLTGTWMAGTVAGWTEATGELAVEATDCAGTGTHADWSIWLRPHAGTAELAGKNLPAVLGTVRHAQPPELGSVQGLWLYRLADGPVRVEPALGHGIHDGGVLLDPAESFPPAPGQAFVDAAEGALWVASRPQYPLTATLDGGLGATAGRRVFAVPGGYSFRVPAGVTALRAKLWGSGGGHGGVGTTGFPGGGGGFVDGVLAVAPGDLLTVVVPGGGGAGNGGVTAGAGGMSPGLSEGGRGGLGSAGSGGGGGGAAGIIQGLTAVLQAPGGGGGSAEAAGGPGGGATGSDGGDGGARHGNGGTTAAGGGGGSGQSGGSAGSAGTASKGGNGGDGSSSGGGGGGGGGRAGGGGGAGPTAGAGGGGAALAPGGSTLAGAGTVPGGVDDADHAAGVGTGGDDGASGGAGRVVLAWTPDAAATATAAGMLMAVLRDRLGFRHVEAGPAVLVSIAADAASRTFTAGGGSFAALGIQPGDQVSFAGLSQNASTNFTARLVGTTSLVVQEAVADCAAETGFSLASGELDAPALAALAAACPQPLGAWLGEETPTGRDLVDRIAATVGAWIDTDPAGLLTVGRHDGPAVVADHALGPRQFTAVRRVAVGPALWRRRIGARRCWRVHGPAEIAPAAAEATRRFLLAEWREGVAEDAIVLTDDLGAEEAFAAGLFDRVADATQEAARQLALHSPAVLAFEVEATLVALDWRPGRTVALTAPEVGLHAPRNLVLVGKALRLEADAVTLTLLG